MSYYSPQTVDVNVFLGTQPSQINTFDTPLALVGHNLSETLLESYLSVKGITEKGFAVNSPAYRMAVGVFDGGIAPPKTFKLGRCDISAYTIKVNTLVAVGSKISVNCNVNGVAKTISVTRSTEGTKDELATLLSTALTTEYPSATTENPQFSPAAGIITVSLDADTFPCSFGWNSSTGLLPDVTIGSVTTDTLADKVNEVLALDDNFSFLMSEYKTGSNIKSLSAIMKGLKLQAFFSTSDANSKDNAQTTSLAEDLKVLGYDNTQLQWSLYADTYFPEAAYLGSFCGVKPYRDYNPSGWSLKGVPTDDQLTEQERITLTERNCNIYVTERGVGVFKDGYASSGQFVDTVRFGIWSDETVTQILFDLKKRKGDLGKSIPYSDGGSLMMKAAIMKDYINVGVRGGRIATGTTEDEFGNLIDLNPVVDFGTRAQQTDADITNRIWRNGKIEVVMLSGINYIETDIYILSNRQFVL